MSGKYQCIFSVALLLMAAVMGHAQSSSPSSGAQNSQQPDTAQPGYWHRVKLYGLIDADSSWNFNDPASKVNTYRNFDYRTNTADINYGELAIETPVEPIIDEIGRAHV